jgi:non-ribosomal peptide synthetase component F
MSTDVAPSLIHGCPLSTDEAGHPLSFPQEQLWLIEGIDPTAGLYNEVWVLRLDGALDVAVLERCLNEVVARHDVLRSTFPLVGREPRCVVLPTVRLSLGEPIDLAHLPAEHHDRLVAELAAGLADRPYDLATGPLVRCSLLRLGHDRHVLLFGTHHAVADGWSLDVVIAEVDALYRDFSAGRGPSLPPLPLQYTDFARWQRAKASGDDWHADLAYWRDQLDGVPPVLDLTGGRLRPPAKSPEGRRIRVDLRPDLAGGIAAVARAESTTRTCVLMAAFAAVLYRYTGQEDLVVGTASSGRPEEEFEPLVGFFANTLPLRFRPGAELPFSDFLEQVTDTTMDAVEHQAVPFSRIVEATQQERDPSYGPLVQVLFSHSELSATPPTTGLVVRPEQVSRTRSRFDLLFEVQTDERTTRLWVEYDTALFDERWVGALCRHYENLLLAVVAGAGRPLGELPMLTPDERSHAISAATPSGAPMPAKTVVVVGAGMLAPPDTLGALHLVHAQLGALAGDRLAGITQPSARLGQWTPDGEPIARGADEDLPVVGGLRVPIEEVQAVISMHPALRRARVTVRQGGTRQAYLEAELSPVRPGAVDAGQLREFLAARLPRYAIPAVFVTAGGEQPAEPAPPVDGGPRARQVRRAVLAALRDALDEPDLGPDADFFVAGGHSMLAAQLVQDLRTELALPVPLKWIFQYPAADQLADAVLREWPDAGAAPRPGPAKRVASAAVRATDASGTAAVPMTAAQADMWVVNRLAPQEPVYNIPMAVRIRGDLDVEALRSAFDHVVARHPTLSSAFGLAEGRLTQRPLGTLPVLRTMMLSCLPADHRVREAEKLRHQEARYPFRLDTEPAVRATLLTLGPDEHELLVVFHHIAADGVAAGVFARELSAAYRAFRDGIEPRLPEPSITWPEYAGWEADWVAGQQADLVEYWRDRLRGLNPARLPTELPRPRRLSFDGDHRHLRAPDVSAPELLDCAARHRVSPFMMATAALSVVLSRVTGSVDLALGTATENRHLPDADKLMGCVINMLVLRLDASGDPTFAQLLERVRDTTLGAYQHQGLPLPKLIRLAGTTHDAGRMTLFQAAVDWQEPDLLGWDLPGCEVDWEYVSTGRARNPLMLTAARRGTHVDLDLEYSTGLWTDAGADAWLHGVAGVLAQAVRDPERRASQFRLDGVELLQTHP